MHRTIARGLLAPAVAAASIAIAGCGAGTLNNPDKVIANALYKDVGQHPRSVSCPDNIPAKKGHVFHCTLTSNSGGTIDVKVTETSLSGSTAHFAILVATQPNA